MTISAAVSRSEFEQSLTQQRILSLQIVYAALTSGIVLFILVGAFLAGESTERQPEGTDILLLLSGVHGLMILTIYTIAPILFRKVVTAKNGSEGNSGNASVPTIIGKIFNAHIVRMALYEGVAMYGLVVCLLSVLWGHYLLQPEFLFNGVSAFLFLVMAAATFPTKERLSGVFAQFFQ